MQRENRSRQWAHPHARTRVVQRKECRQMRASSAKRGTQEKNPRKRGCSREGSTPQRRDARRRTPFPGLVCNMHSRRTDFYPLTPDRCRRPQRATLRRLLRCRRHAQAIESPQNAARAFAHLSRRKRPQRAAGQACLFTRQRGCVAYAVAVGRGKAARGLMLRGKAARRTARQGARSIAV